MSEPVKVSVVVPVYNVEKYLSKCVNSLLTQTLADIEIILVDDGSTDTCPQLCDQYAAQDSRVRVIHQANGGLGVAYNAGLDAAQGQYIGFVESDDWVDKEMYKTLYALACQHQVDVVKSIFRKTYDGKPSRIVNKFRSSAYLNRRIDDATQIPEFYMGHVCHWSAIYRKDFLTDNHIRFHETPGAQSQDISFAWQVFTKMKSCYILPQAFYNYYQNPAASSALGYKTAMNGLNEHFYVRQCIKETHTPTIFREIEAITVFHSVFYHYNTTVPAKKKYTYLAQASQLFKQYLPEISFSLFTNKEKKKFIHIAKHPFLFHLRHQLIKTVSTPSRKYVSVFGVRLRETRISPQKRRKRFLGIPYKKYIYTQHHVKKYFLGIRYKKANLDPSSHYSKYNAQVQLLQTIAHANAISATHQKTFGKYKNFYQGKDVALVCTGPTLQFFSPIKDTVYVGINKAVLYDKIHLDYIFFQDAAFPHNEYKEAVNNYPNAKKFYGILQDCIRTNWIVSESDAIKAHAERYYVISQWAFPPVHFTYDIANEPLGCFGSVSYAAMQFILWTHPRRIYIIGQDCTTAYFDNSYSENTNDHARGFLLGWLKMAEFIKVYYPDIEIVSINPVGLRGIFTDKYTRSYLAEHPELNISQNDIID